MKLRFGIPLYINVKGSVYNIIIADEIEGDRQGLCSYSDKKIFIQKDSDRAEMRRTFLHELCHAILFEIGFHQTSLTYEAEQILVENFSHVLEPLFYARNTKNKKLQNRVPKDN